MWKNTDPAYRFQQAQVRSSYIMGISITNNIHGCLSSVYRNSISISKCFHIICKDLIHKTFSAIIVEKFVSGDAIYVNTSTRDRGAAMDFMSAMSMMVSLLLTYITSPDRYFSTMVARKVSLTQPSWQRRRRAPL